MSKKEEYIHEINNNIEFAGKTYKEIANDLREKFKEVYGDYGVDWRMCKEDEGFALIPVWIKFDNNEKYIALMDICVQDSGENYGGQVLFPNKGFVAQEDLKNHFSEKELEEMFPYQYRPLVKIVGDTHTHRYF